MEGHGPDEQTVAALVPARGGSTTVPEKNLRVLGDRPLVAWPICTAMSTQEVNGVYITTDDDEIATVSREYGASVINRPPELATDDALVIDAIKHAISSLTEAGQRPDRTVLLEPTCPFRAVKDIQRCLELLDDGYDSAATFVNAEVNPHRTWTLDGDEPEPFVDGADPWVPRQQTPEAYQLSGGCYVFDTSFVEVEDGPSLLFGQAAGVKMPSKRAVDIDSPLDLRVARTLVEEKEITQDE